MQMVSSLHWNKWSHEGEGTDPRARGPEFQPEGTDFTRSQDVIEPLCLRFLACYKGMEEAT